MLNRIYLLVLCEICAVLYKPRIVINVVISQPYFMRWDLKFEHILTILYTLVGILIYYIDDEIDEIWNMKNGEWWWMFALNDGEKVYCDT